MYIQPSLILSIYTYGVYLRSSHRKHTQASLIFNLINIEGVRLIISSHIQPSKRSIIFEYRPYTSTYTHLRLTTIVFKNKEAMDVFQTIQILLKQIKGTILKLGGLTTIMRNKSNPCKVPQKLFNGRILLSNIQIIDILVQKNCVLL